ncbi:hypothetical protein NT6N_26910 [Oceaniferula spumae]|uniref:non-specific serine/threonine protein kinase n=1 Tax=Oceaniferula spumae TaxID=2979115 RepID=A0AAT9FP15_9BACT
MKFHIVKFGGRPLMAFPSSETLPVSLRAAAIRCFPEHTGKKRLVKKSLHRLSSLGLLTWIYPARENFHEGLSGNEFENWFVNLARQLDRAEIFPVLVWPGDPNRGRIYIYLLDTEGEPFGFCKLALDEKNNRLIEKEEKALGHLKSMQLRSFRIPRLLNCGDFSGFRHLVVETTPSNARAIHWGEGADLTPMIDEFSGHPRLIGREEIETLNWWSAMKQTLEHRTSLWRVINASVDDGVEVCRVHGDLNRTNVLLHGDEHWLLDWEQSHENGPYLTDRMCCEVDAIWLETPEDSKGNLKKLQMKVPMLRDEKTRGPSVLALAFLGSAGFTPALAILTELFPE